MQWIHHTASPLGGLLLAADEQGLTGLWFEGAAYFAAGLPPECMERELPVFRQTERWLDAYFAGRRPENLPPLHLLGTPFRQEVWALLQKIPYGATTTYGALAAELAASRGAAHLSAQAVGGAVGHNPISILVPCHRVVGARGLTGYAGGIEKKQALLALEQAGLAQQRNSAAVR